jgi:hypothetical protein
MKFRWKLLIILLAISIMPIVGLRTFGIQNVRLMADALISQVKGKQLDDARRRLQLVINEYSNSIHFFNKIYLSLPAKGACIPSPQLFRMNCRAAELMGYPK